MEWMYFIGCFLITYSIPIWVLIFIIIPSPQLMVICFTSSLFYVAAIIINSILWKLLPFLQSSNTIYVLVGVLIIESVRPLYFGLFDRGRRSFKTVSTNRVIFPLDDLNCSISAGYGWGIVHILLYYSSYVFKSIGPGTYYDNNCSLFSVITKSSFFSFSLFLQNIFLMIIFYDSLSKKSNLQWWFTVFLHLFASLWAEFEVNCILLVLGELGIAFGEGIWCWYLIHRPKYRRKLKEL